MIIPPDYLLDLYRAGRFPMADERDGEIYIYDPDPRGIIPLDAFHVPDSLRKTLKSGRFEIRINTDFKGVIAACADRDNTWISGDIMESYICIHELGLAHSVEAYQDGELAGGLYGVSLSGAFFGESMFHFRRDASKAALVALVERMRERQMTLLDTQFTTPHLERFGAREISRARYRRLLVEALRQDVEFYL